MFTLICWFFSGNAVKFPKKNQLTTSHKIIQQYICRETDEVENLIYVRL